jgi:chemotaxis signal transduction protein
MSLCLLLQAGAERLAVRAADIHKVVGHAPLCRLPRLPAAFLGIAHHRGKVFTAVDASALLFGAPQQTPSDGTRLVVLDRLQRHLALGVDAVFDIEELALGAAMPPGPSPALRVCDHRGQAVFFVDVDRLLALILAQKFLPTGSSV